MSHCRVYDSACINPGYCAERDACCAGDPDCKPHCDLGAAACSQCAGAVPRVITIDDGTTYVDGVSVGRTQPETQSIQAQRAAARGGKASRGRARRKR